MLITLFHARVSMSFSWRNLRCILDRAGMFLFFLFWPVQARRPMLIMPIAPCATPQTPVASACSVKTDFLACTTQFCLGMGCTVTEAANRETLCRSYWWGWNCYYGLSNSNREQKNWLFNSYRLLFDCTSAGIVLLCIYGKWLPLGWESSNSFCHNQC